MKNDNECAELFSAFIKGPSGDPIGAAEVFEQEKTEGVSVFGRRKASQEIASFCEEEILRLKESWIPFYSSQEEADSAMSGEIWTKGHSIYACSKMQRYVEEFFVFTLMYIAVMMQEHNNQLSHKEAEESRKSYKQLVNSTAKEIDSLIQFRLGQNPRYKDQVLICQSCGAEFVFSAEEQAFFDERGFSYRPTHCRACRNR